MWAIDDRIVGTSSRSPGDSACTSSRIEVALSVPASVLVAAAHAPDEMLHGSAPTPGFMLQLEFSMRQLHAPARILEAQAPPARILQLPFSWLQRTAFSSSRSPGHSGMGQLAFSWLQRKRQMALSSSRSPGHSTCTNSHHHQLTSRSPGHSAGTRWHSPCVCASSYSPW
jgi:hypothetical protein